MGCGIGIICLLVLYVIWDVNYFIRVVFTVGLGRLFEKKRKITDTTKIYGKPAMLIEIKLRFVRMEFFFE